MKKAALLLTLLPGLASAQQTSTMKLSIQVENRILTANLIDSKTTRDFISLLPLTLTMNDLFGREKWGQLRGRSRRMERGCGATTLAT